jgi:hypothetical protein
MGCEKKQILFPTLPRPPPKTLVATRPLQNFISTWAISLFPGRRHAVTWNRPNYRNSIVDRRCSYLLRWYSRIHASTLRVRGETESSEVKEEKESFDTRSNCVTWGALWIMWASFRWSRVAALIPWDYFFPTDLESGGSISMWEIAKEIFALTTWMTSKIAKAARLLGLSSMRNFPWRTGALTIAQNSRTSDDIVSSNWIQGSWSSGTRNFFGIPCTQKSGNLLTN